MKQVLVIHKNTGQSVAFERFSAEYTAKNNLEINWLFANDKNYEQIIEENNFDRVYISPEVILIQAKVENYCNAKGIKTENIKPADFGLKRIDKIIANL